MSRSTLLKKVFEWVGIGGEVPPDVARDRFVDAPQLDLPKAPYMHLVGRFLFFFTSIHRSLSVLPDLAFDD